MKVTPSSTPTMLQTKASTDGDGSYSCSNNEYEFSLNISTSNNIVKSNNQVRWRLRKRQGDKFNVLIMTEKTQPISSSNGKHFSICLPKEECYRFTIIKPKPGREAVQGQFEITLASFRGTYHVDHFKIFVVRPLSLTHAFVSCIERTSENSPK